MMVSDVMDIYVEMHIWLTSSHLDTSILRISYWLSNTLQSLMSSYYSETSHEHFKDLLAKLITMARLTRVSIKVID